MSFIEKKIVFYMRYSSNNQREDSIIDQRRNITDHLNRLGIPYEGAIEISDEAISGTHTNRPGFQKLSAMINKGEVGLLIVDDLSRLTRGNDVGAFWDKMEIYGSRFISVLDGFDSIREGDELAALVKGIMNKMTNKIHGKRVRRGIAGRALEPFGSAGNHPYGYGSRYSDPEAALNYSGSGPRPKKEVFIDEEEAPHVRKIFHLFVVLCWSIAKIVRHLNKNNVTTGKRARIRTPSGTQANPTWNKTHVSRILKNCKYRGIWRYGENICRKTDNGRQILRPADPKDIIEVVNPDLAIITDEIWEGAQKRLAEIKDLSVKRFGEKKRGPKRHYTEEYPNGTCGGIVYCGDCGRKMQRVPKFVKNNKVYGPYYRCANAIPNGLDERGGQCSHKSFVREEHIFEALAGYARDYLRSRDGWLDEALSEVRKACASHYALAPGQLKQLKDRQREVTSSINHIMAEIERGHGNGTPGVLLERLKILDNESNGIDSKLRRLEAIDEKEASFPSDDWVRAQLAGMAGILEESPEKAGILFRQLFGRAYVRTILSPGKSRGHSVISFSPRNNDLVIHVANLDGTPGLESMIGQIQDAETVSIDLPGYDKFDKLMPTIHAMRLEGRTWAAIGHELRIGQQWASKCHKDWLKANAVELIPPLRAKGKTTSSAG